MLRAFHGMDGEEVTGLRALLDQCLCKMQAEHLTAYQSVQPSLLPAAMLPADACALKSSKPHSRAAMVAHELQ